MDADAILDRFRAELAPVGDAKSLNDLKVAWLGRNGVVNGLRKSVDFSGMTAEQKRAVGEGFNRIKQSVEEALAAAQERFESAEAAAESIPFDPTVPGSGQHVGALHPITLVQFEVEEIFRSMGFQVFTGDEAVTEYENFDALNIPADHPARDMQDTFWLTEELVLRTHTSAMQNRAIRTLGVPLRAIFPGRCFRNETTDPTHETTFYQLEGMMIGREVSVAHLIAVMKALLDRVFDREIQVRLRPGFFPFVEPGFELDFRGTVGKSERWIELMPCGMIHPAVLRNAGVDPDEYSGFAFGLGLTRLAMLKFGIPDIRLLNGGDLRFLQQFPATL